MKIVAKDEGLDPEFIRRVLQPEESLSPPLLQAGKAQDSEKV